MIKVFQGLFAGDAKGFAAQAAKLRRKVRCSDPAKIAKLVSDDLAATLAMEALLRLMASGEERDPAARKAFAKKHSAARLGRFAATVLWAAPG